MCQDSVLKIENLIYLQKYLNHIASSYPRFEQWYKYKAIPGIMNGDRTLLVEQKDNTIAGIAILKNDEKKISTLVVSPSYQKMGIGKTLFEQSFSVLNTNFPFFTVSEKNLSQFQNLINQFNFSLTSKHHNLYTKDSTEFFFNENNGKQ